MLSYILKVKAFIDANIPHWMILVVATGIGAAFSYVQAEPQTDLVAALTHWTLIVPIAKGAGLAFLGTVLALLKKAPWTDLMGGSSSGGGPVTTGFKSDGPNFRGPPPPPPVQTRMPMPSRKILSIPPAAIALLLCGCGLLQSPIIGKVEQTILNDLAAGDTRTQIETDVAYVLGGKVGVDIAVVVNDAITFAIDAGWVSPNILPAAQALQMDERAAIKAKGLQSELDKTDADLASAVMVVDAVAR